MIVVSLNHDLRYPSLGLTLNTSPGVSETDDRTEPDMAKDEKNFINKEIF